MKQYLELSPAEQLFYRMEMLKSIERIPHNKLSELFSNKNISDFIWEKSL